MPFELANKLQHVPSEPLNECDEPKDVIWRIGMRDGGVVEVYLAGNPRELPERGTMGTVTIRFSDGTTWEACGEVLGISLQENVDNVVSK